MCGASQNRKGHWNAYLVQGSPYITASYHGLTPEFTALSDFADVACPPKMHPQSQHASGVAATTTTAAEVRNSRAAASAEGGGGGSSSGSVADLGMEARKKREEEDDDDSSPTRKPLKHSNSSTEEEEELSSSASKSKSTSSPSSKSSSSRNSASEKAYALLHKYLTMWFATSNHGNGTRTEGGRNIDRLLYDVEFGGIVSRDGLEDPMADFGNGR